MLLKIILGCLIAIGIAAVLFVCAIFLYIRNALKGCVDDHSTPLAIHLNEDLAPDWLDHKKCAPILSEFKQLGFTQGKAYLIEEMDEVKIVSFFNEKYTGTVYQLENHGFSFEISHVSQNEQIVCVSTTPFSSTFESPPETEKIVMENATVSEAFKTLDDRCKGEETKALNPEQYRELAETYYKKEQAFRIKNGGVSFEEFNSIAKADKKKKYTDEQIREAFIESKTDELDTWNEAALEEFFQSNKMTDEERYGGGCFLIVPRKTDAEAYVHFLNNYDMIHDDHVDKVGQSVRQDDNIIDLFARINSARSPELRAIERGDVTFPVEAKIYQLAS